MQKKYCFPKLLGFFILICLPLSGFSQSNSFLSPRTFQYINLGDSLNAVKSKCGVPTTQSTQTVPILVNQPIEQWFYENKNRAEIYGRKPDMVVTILNGKVDSIEAAGQTLSGTSLCNVGTLKKGDSAVRLRQVCGPPSFVSQATRQVSKGLKKTTTLICDFGQYRPKVSFEFEGDKLTRFSQQ